MNIPALRRLLLVLVAVKPIEAQAWRADADDAGHALVPGLIVAGTLFATGLDRVIAMRARNAPGFLSPSSAVMRVGAGIGPRGPLVLAGAITVGGYAGNDPRLASLGTDMFGAIALGYAISLPLKAIVGRRRPYAGTGSAFRFGAGIRNHEFTSFPSTHASAAFATATVLATGVTHASLTQRKVIGGAAYLAAAAVATSRIMLGEHWASDVVAGAAIGVGAGLVVTSHLSTSAGAFTSRSAVRAQRAVPVPLLHLRF